MSKIHPAELKELLDGFNGYFMCYPLIILKLEIRFSNSSYIDQKDSINSPTTLWC